VLSYSALLTELFSPGAQHIRINAVLQCSVVLHLQHFSYTHHPAAAALLLCCHRACLPSSQPCLSKCQECSMRNDTCCPGFSCQKSARSDKTYCQPDCVPYKPQCAAAGGLCGFTAGGNKCCKGRDCIVGKDGTGVCTPQERCKPKGSACGGYGECGSGLFCALNGKCEVASCKSQGKKFPRSAAAQTQKNAFHYQCQAFFDATCSGAQ
jgi:hypothetical protein